MENLINRVIKFTEHITDGKDFKKSEILDVLNLIDSSDRNLNVYRGILALFYFAKFNGFPDRSLEKLKTDENFIKCLSFLKGDTLPPPEEVGGVFLNILQISSSNGKYRDILMGCFYGSLWSFMNSPENFEKAIEYGIAIVKSAFNLDNLDIQRKLNLDKNKVKVISLAGSGKKEIKLLNISSMAAIITAATGKKIGENIVVEKTVSRATSSITGSSDIFELVGVNLNLPIDKMADISLKTRLGVFDINLIVPRLNHVYDGRLHDVQVFAGLIGGAAIVNPVDADLINYGLTRGATELCLAILNKLYPGKNILVLQGKDPEGTPVIDQISISANTEIAQSVKNQATIKEITPKDFGFDFKPFKYIETSQNPKENLNEFIKILIGRGSEELKQTVAMEVALNLFGLEMVDDLKIGAELALETINSSIGIKVLEDLVVHSGGNRGKFNNILANI
ncbi:MAG: Anthranilate phosphoribosyltransferase [candidate division WS2 bacterium]|nr:Anthranilate phosphoribosyltransferase [Candidatus Lithacetigena glycinireducens]